MIYVGSLKYSPVFKSHCCAFGNAAKKQGYRVRYLLSRKYEWMLTKEMKEETIFIGNSSSISSMSTDAINPMIMKKIRDIILEGRPTHIYLHNYHILNHYVAKICKKCGGKFIYHMHEPHVENKSAHGGVLQYLLYLHEYMEGKLLSDTDVAIVSSSEASSQFDKAYPHFQAKKVEVPLMYEDLGGTRVPFKDRKYITSIGPPVPSKGPETLLGVFDYSARHTLGWSFLLISRSKVKDPGFHGTSNVTVFYKPYISDEEFGSLIRRSLVVFMPFKRETQSSAVFVSYMYGTPVVTTSIGGLPEFVNHGKTGYLVDENASIEEWIKGIDYAMKNFHRMSKNCRNYFVRMSSGKNWIKYFDRILI